MSKSRSTYSLLFLLIICFGIVSRQIEIIPLYIGDLLYAVMMYVLIRIILINKKGIQVLIISLLICYTIEFLQLYQAEWIITIRKTIPGRYILGQGFLWSDVLAYTLGGVIAFTVEKIVLKINQKSA